MGVFALEDRRSGRFVGHCGLNFLEGGDDVELIYLVRRERWGEGLATEAAGAALAYGFQVLEIPRIHCVIMPGNGASRQVAAKLGMGRAGMRRCYGHDLCCYYVDAADFTRLAPLMFEMAKN